MKIVSAYIMAAVAMGAAAWANPPVVPSKPAQLVGQYPLTRPKPEMLLHATFQDHAVLQRGKPIPVWGQAAPKAKVRVRLGDETKTATADKAGVWRATFAALPAGGPYVLSAEASDGRRQTVSDLMIGDVFLCSGQSNMEMPVSVASNYNADIGSATNAAIRLFHVERFPSAVPRDGFGADAAWAVLSPKSVTDFSAACYNFGRHLQPKIGVPVGLIEDAWGGSILQAWLSADSLRALGGHDAELALLPVYAADPRAGETAWAAVAAAWWAKHDPALTAKPAWTDPAFDDSAWVSATAAGPWRLWQPEALKTFDGTVWLRKTVDVAEVQAKGAATLALGAIDTADILYVNGRLVAAGRGYDILRTYEIPAGVLHAGRNLIALGIQGGGGPQLAGDRMVLTAADGSSQTLGGPWKVKVSMPADKLGAMPLVPWLNQFGLGDLYNGMIRPLGRTQIRGVVWYQGESNENEPETYARMLSLLIGDWRRQFGAEVPVTVVQLPNFGPQRSTPAPSNWAALRAAQAAAVAADRNAALVATIDVGQVDNIHPTNKQEVGRRIALAVEKLVYGLDVVASGPVAVSARRVGDTVRVRFVHPGTGMHIVESNRPQGFQLCDGARHCRFVDANRDGDDIVLKADASDVSVRYAWADSPLVNLYGDTGLPAAPFEMAVTP